MLGLNNIRLTLDLPSESWSSLAITVIIGEAAITGGGVLFRDLQNQIKNFTDESKFILLLLFFTLLTFGSPGKIVLFDFAGL